MIFFSSKSTNLLYYKILEYAYQANLPFSESRVGAVKDLGPACYELVEDDIRLLFLNGRGFNPFFALAEFSWLISGNNLVKPLSFYISDYKKFSDDGSTLNGAYGYRLRHYFQLDQIDSAINILKKDSSSRRVVLTMWDVEDLGSISLDVPCNTAAYLKIRDNKLNITVTCRSNDLYLGVPYNIVIFYLLQKYIANALGVEIGTQMHYADSLHLYERDIESVKSVLSQNNLSGITETSSSFNDGWAERFLNIPHDKLLKREFDFSDVLFSDVFKSIELCKSGSVSSAVQSLKLEKTGLMFSAYQWYRERQSFQVKDAHAGFEKLRGGLCMKDILSSVDAVKYEDEEVIQASVEKAISEFDIFYDDLVALLDAEKGMIKVDITQRKRNLAAIYLSLVYATINPMNPYVRDELVHKLGTVAASYDLTCRDLLFLSSYESRIISILKRKEV